MKKFCFVLCALLAGCSTPPPARTDRPPMPPHPVVRKAIHSPRATPDVAPRILSAAPGAPPAWTFTNLNGIHQIDASTNLIDWWPMVVVYHVTNVTLTSDTVAKRPMLFFRVQPAQAE